MGWYGEYWKPSKPKKVAGGITARSQKGEFGTNWWAKKWVAVLEGLLDGGRLQRGRRYARTGQVLKIAVYPGRIEAEVQGSRSYPYKVTIEVAQLLAADWERVVARLAARAGFVAKLLAGALPEGLEELFAELKLSLFPRRAKDLESQCSCPDYENPCKHIAAVYYLLAETFDRDPFLLFQLRGRDRAALLSGLGEVPIEPSEPLPVLAPKAPAAKAAPKKAVKKAVKKSGAAAIPDEPEPQFTAAEFWQVGRLPPERADDFLPATRPGVLPQRLGPIPLWRGEERFPEALDGPYERARRAALLASGADWPDAAPEPPPAPAPVAALPERKKRPQRRR